METPGQALVFVGSSTEAKECDILVRCYLERNDAQVLSWRDVFEAGDYCLDALNAIASRIDAALLIATPDDVLTFRGAERVVPRDNILVELGFFAAKLGRQRTGLLYVQSPTKPPLKLPTDLDGLTVIMFDPGRDAVNERALAKWVRRVGAQAHARSYAWNHIRKITETLETVPDIWLPHITASLLERQAKSLLNASRGSIDLRSDQYYRLIYAEMDVASPATEVRAVASLSPSRWLHNEDQKGYIERNIAAALRGVRIRRLFVLSEDVRSIVAPAAQRMADAGIAVRFARPGRWQALQKIQDMVMFTDGESLSSRCYVAVPDSDYPLRIDSAELNIDPNSCSERAKLFDRLWQAAADFEKTDLEAGRFQDSTQGNSPPGYGLRRAYLEGPVVTCEEASLAKKIPLKEELKTLILETSIGVVAVHLPGNRKVSLRAVKKALNCREAHLASRAKLSALGLAPGTVCPVLDPVWYMRNLLCSSVLELADVSTNNGTLTGFVRFKPALLLQAPNVHVGSFSVPADD